MNIASTPLVGIFPAAQPGTALPVSGGGSLPPLSTFAELLGGSALPNQPLQIAPAVTATLAPFSLGSALASSPAQPNLEGASLQMTIAAPVADLAATQAPAISTELRALELQLPETAALAGFMAEEAGGAPLPTAPDASALLTRVPTDEPLVPEAPAAAREFAKPAKTFDAALKPELTLPGPAAPQVAVEEPKQPGSSGLTHLPDQQFGRFRNVAHAPSQSGEVSPKQALDSAPQHLAEAFSNPELSPQQDTQVNPGLELPLQQVAQADPDLQLATQQVAQVNPDLQLHLQQVAQANPDQEPAQRLFVEPGEFEAEPDTVMPASQERATTLTVAAPASAPLRGANEAAAPEASYEPVEATRSTAPLPVSSATADRLPGAESNAASGGAAPAASPSPVAAAATSTSPPAPAPAAAPTFAPAAPTDTAASSVAPSPSPEPQVTARPGQIGRELGVEIARRAAAGGDELLVRLNPQEMGRIEVRMHFNEAGSLRAHVTVESAAALEMLQRDAGDLGRALADAGVRADQQSLKFDGRGSGDAGSAWHRQGRNGEQRPEPEQHAGFEAGEGEEAAYRPLPGQGRIDLMA